MAAMKLIKVINKYKHYRCNNYRLYFDGDKLVIRCFWSPNLCLIRQWDFCCVLDSGKYTEYYNGKSTS